ncbi:MAG: TIGR01620 family protein [Geminicoccaceae bacterium]
MRKPIRPFQLDPSTAEVELVDMVEEPEAKVLPPASGGLGWWWFWIGVAGVIGLAMLAQAVSAVRTWTATMPWIGWPFAALLVATVMAGIVMMTREIIAVRRLGNRSLLQAEAARVAHSREHGESDALITRLGRSIRGQEDAFDRFERSQSDHLSDGERVRLFETTVMTACDRSAYQAVVRGARDIGIITAVSPLGVLDSVLVLWRSIAMLRSVARAYGLPGGAFANVVLFRRTIRNMMLAGLTDVISHSAVEAVGASFIGMLSARAGSGAANALLASRLGLEAIRTTRPLPFTAVDPPKLSHLRSAVFQGLEEAKPKARTPR